MTFEITGEYNTATVHTNKLREDCEDEALEQIEEMVNAKAFKGGSEDSGDVSIMPDFHWGAGAVIGFTMPVKDRVVPNTVGVDIGCFAGETEVKLLDGEDYRIEDLAERKERFAVYSSTEEGKVDIAWATAKKTRDNAELMTVEIDNGEKIRCTPDHRFMKRDGTFEEARNLTEGDSLMPLYQGKTDDGYVLDFHNNSEFSVREHWLVARSDCMDIPKDIDDMVIHHKNFDKKDNRPCNLEFMNRSEEWLEKISGNGERGGKYLKEFNTSERECSICGRVCNNPSSEYWHQIKEHPEKTSYEDRDNHKVKSVTECDETEDVYCLTVPKYGNFALSAGVFVHNCGMYAVNFGKPSINFHDEKNLQEVDQEIRKRVPTGFDVHDRNDYHMIEDFPYTTCEQKWDRFAKSTDFDLPQDEIPKFPRDTYFNEVCKKVGNKQDGYDQDRAINSMGTLGRGNHFIELGCDEDGDIWCVIHSGSRGIGAEIAKYWQKKATDRMNERAMDTDIPDEIEPYLSDNWKPKASKIRSEFSGKDIQQMFDKISQFIQKTKNAEEERNTDLDYLEGEEAHGYIKDMIFAQTYASESRKKMARAVHDAVKKVELGVVPDVKSIEDSIESVHNYIDFNDGVIRKGACRAHDGERLIVPFNMKAGTIIARGKGNDEWNKSSAHGAGRAMSRAAAKQKFSDDDFSSQTKGVYMSKHPLDEIPKAYKSPEDIEAALGGNVTVENRIKPFLSVKAE